MSDQSAIEWTDATWNPVTGCSKFSPGCAHCYAEALSLRFGWSPKPWTPDNATLNVILHPERLDLPRRWRGSRRIFVNSMSDLFHELVPDGYVHDVFEVMASCPQHQFQVLTKRHERLAEIAPRLPWPDNVWIGVRSRTIAGRSAPTLSARSQRPSGSSAPSHSWDHCHRSTSTGSTG